MTVARRTFLKVFGMSAAAAPVTAKAVIDEQISELTLARAVPLSTTLSGYISDPDAGIKMSDHAKLLGVPSFIEQRVRNSSKYVACLDPDIACKRSFSMSYKILLQQQRNYEREMERLRGVGLTEKAHRLFDKTFGFRWDV